MSRGKQIEEMAQIIKKPCVEIFNEAGKVAQPSECPFPYECDECTAINLYNAGYRKQEWISVEERLPEGDGDFLVWNDFHGIIVGHYFARGKYFISKACTVTHWMPLPSMPEKEKNDD